MATGSAHAWHQLQLILYSMASCFVLSTSTCHTVPTVTVCRRGMPRCDPSPAVYQYGWYAWPACMSCRRSPDVNLRGHNTGLPDDSQGVVCMLLCGHGRLLPPLNAECSFVGLGLLSLWHRPLHAYAWSLSVHSSVAQCS